MSKFTISTEQGLPSRVKDAIMENTELFRVVSPHKERRRAVLIKRDQPAAFLFRLERQSRSAGSDVQDDSHDTRMRITFLYRTVEADLLAILKPHLSSILKKHEIYPSRRIVPAISSLFASDRHLITHFNKLRTLDRIGKDEVQLSTCQEPARFRNYKDSLRSFWTTEDEWERIRAAILEAYQVSCHQPDHPT